jgi:hypothetical protein
LRVQLSGKRQRHGPVVDVDRPVRPFQFVGVSRRQEVEASETVRVSGTNGMLGGGDADPVVGKSDVIGDEVGDPVALAFERDFDRCWRAVATDGGHPDGRRFVAPGKIAQEASEPDVLEHRRHHAARDQPLLFEPQRLGNKFGGRGAGAVMFENNSAAFLETLQETAPTRAFLGRVTPLVSFIIGSAREIEIRRGRNRDRQRAGLAEQGEDGGIFPGCANE